MHISDARTRAAKLSAARIRVSCCEVELRLLNFRVYGLVL